MPKRKWRNYDSNPSDNGKRSRSDKHHRMDDRNIPEKILTNLYCRTCDSDMNSEIMWRQHISGKRHLKNLKKGPDEAPSKVKSVICNDVPLIQEKLDEVEEPVVGLDYICEKRRADPAVDPFYNCVLCRGAFTVSAIIDHLISQKHRMLYLKKEYKNFHKIDSLRLNWRQLHGVVKVKAAKMEGQLGRGTITVKIEKNNGELPRSYLPLVRRPEIGVGHSYNHVPSPASSITSSVPPAESSWLEDVRPSSNSSHSRDFKSKTSTSKAYGPLSKPSTSRDSFLSKLSTSKDSTLSKFKDLPSSEASTSKRSSTAHISSPPKVLAPEEIDWDLERDAKYLTTEQQDAILEVVEKDVSENPSSYVEDPRKLDVLAECIRVRMERNIFRALKTSTLEEKKIMYKNLCTDHPQRFFLSEFKKHSVL